MKTKITLKNGSTYDDAYISDDGEVHLRKFGSEPRNTSLTIKEYIEQWKSGVINPLRGSTVYPLDVD